MIYNSISDACLVVFAPNLDVDSIEFDQNSMQMWQQLFISSTMADYALISGCHVCLHERSKWRLSSKLRFFLMWFMHLIFIYFSKRVGVSYWRWALVRNMVWDVVIDLRVVCNYEMEWLRQYECSGWSESGLWQWDGVVEAIWVWWLVWEWFVILI